MTVDRLQLPAKQNAVQQKINEIIDNLGGGGGGSSTDVQINGTSITNQGVANIITESAYNASSNKIATMGDVPTNALINVASDVNSIAVGGSATSNQNIVAIGKNSAVSNSATAIGYGSIATASSVSIGSQAQASVDGSIAIGASASSNYSSNRYGSIAIGADANISGDRAIGLGSGAVVTANQAYQIGYGTNSTAKTLNIGFYDDTTPTNWQLLDGTTGLIPDSRISTNIERTSNKTTSLSGSSTDTQYPSAKVVWDNLTEVAPTLFEFRWFDHLINNQNWLRADTFSWHSGSTYSNPYNHLVSDISGITSETETIGSYTVTFYRATDGHKICLADQEGTVNNIYAESGISWYYILDTTNTRFKAPRTKFGFEGLRDYVGDKIDAGLPNITGSYTNPNIRTFDSTSTGCFSSTASGNVSPAEGSKAGTQLKFDASRSSSIYGNSTTVQEPATQMYLYFYVGGFTQNATLQTAGLNSELFNGKADITAVDGQWVYSKLGLDSNTSIHSSTFNLGTTGTGALNYLPADCTIYDYEVLLYIYGASNTSSQGFVGTTQKPFTNPNDGFLACVIITASAQRGVNSVILPITNGMIYTEVGQNAFVSNFKVVLFGYRRLGTNP